MFGEIEEDEVGGGDVSLGVSSVILRMGCGGLGEEENRRPAILAEWGLERRAMTLGHFSDIWWSGD